MNARKPPVRSCTSRIIRRCSMRSALVSPVPMSIVEVDSTPRLCAVSMISSQRSPDSLSGAIALRGRAGSSSAPAPANESRPAAWIRWMGSPTRPRAAAAREQLGAGAGERVEAGRVDPLDGLLDAHLGDAGHVLDLGRAEGVD